MFVTEKGPAFAVEADSRGPVKTGEKNLQLLKAPAKGGNGRKMWKILRGGKVWPGTEMGTLVGEAAYRKKKTRHNGSGGWKGAMSLAN